MISDKWYYELEEIESGEKLYVSVDMPIKPEKICSALGIDHIFKCTGMVTKEKYLAETEDEDEDDD